MNRVDIRRVGISVLGPLTIVDSAARLSPRETIILAALAAKAGEVLGPDQLADVVWGNSPPQSWHKNLQSCIVRLRKVLGPESIETSPQGYRLNLPHDDVDARQFETLAVRGRELLTLGEPERAAYTLSQALALWRVALSTSSRSGSRERSRRRGSANSASTPRSGGWTRPFSPATTATS